MSAPSAVSLVIVGAGPTTASLVERLSASAEELLGARPVVVHLVDPHRIGSGRVWRPDLDPLLWMNSLPEDVTMFTDSSVRCDGPIRPGPSLLQWAGEVSDAELAEVAEEALAAEIRALDARTFPSRRVQSAYLEWFLRATLAQAPPTFSVQRHTQQALDVVELGEHRQRVVLQDGSCIDADVVVLSLGHLDAEPPAEGAAHRDFATRQALTYVPPGHTGDLDLSALAPGTDVLVSGFGQAFTDLMILLSAGRGGRFVPRRDGTLRYEPSGREPVLHVGSRRGVPYRSKLDYRLQAPLAPLPYFLDNAALARLRAADQPLDFRRDLFPLVAKEVGWAYYHELFNAHGDRGTVGWESFAVRYQHLPWGPEIDALVAETVPDPDDRLDLDGLDRPLRGVRVGSADSLQPLVAGHIAADLARRTNAHFSADLGAFMALLSSFGALTRLAGWGCVSERSRVQDISGTWFSFFMYYASGPPPTRLRQYLALHEAGLLRFLGAELQITHDEQLGRFVAQSASHPDDVTATALVDARIAPASVSRTTDPLLGALYRRGEVVEEVVSDGLGWQLNTGKVVVSGRDLRVVGADGRSHARRHGLGAFTNRPASGVLSRPRSNAPTFRQNDVVARAVLATLAAVAAEGGRAEPEVLT